MLKKLKKYLNSFSEPIENNKPVTLFEKVKETVKKTTKRTTGKRKTTKKKEE